MDLEYSNFWPINVLQHLEVLVVGNDIFCIGGHGTVYKLVVIGILGNQTEMDIDFLIDCCAEPSNGFHYATGNLFGCLLSKHFLILIEYFSVDT